MTWISLPVTQANSKASFTDSKGALAWLAAQPQANVSAMLNGLTTQIEALNATTLAPRERFKTLEVLRKSVFAVTGDYQRKFDNKPLPLLPTEQTALDAIRRLWRSYTTAYLHCLHACLEHDASLAEANDKVTHRTLACLRMEQMNCILGGVELASDFWKLLHSILASAEQLGVAKQPVEDRLLGETSDSTINGQYCMILLLQLARPFALSRGQVTAATRWLARWREQVELLNAPDENPKAYCLALDFSGDCPPHAPTSSAKADRWLSLGGILRKISKRRERLAAGESPESLKLGTGLTAEACIALLDKLTHHLKNALPATPDTAADSTLTVVAIGLERSHRLLGGTGLKEKAPVTPYSGTLSAEQLTVFDHVVRAPEEDRNTHAETWRASKQTQGKRYDVQLIRPPSTADTRLIFKGLISLQLPQQTEYALAVVSSLFARGDKKEACLYITANLLPGTPEPLVAEVLEKPTGQVSRHPAFLLPATSITGSPSVILPTGLQARAVSIQFFDAEAQLKPNLKIATMLERGADYERWTLAVIV